MFASKHGSLEQTRKRAGFRMGNRRGSTLIVVCVGLVVVFAFAVLAIDGAILMTSKTQLQSAADAAALAGASGLLAGSQDEATARAMAFSSYNKAVQDLQTPVVISASDVTFPQSDVCRVRTHRTAATDDSLKTYFLRVLPGGAASADMTAVAAAQAFDVCGSKCIKPWVIPDNWDDANANGVWDPGEAYNPDVTGFQAPRDVGMQITLKNGNNPNNPISPGIYYPVCFPPLDNEEGIKPETGGADYEQWIAQCEPYMVDIGDRLLLEPGALMGPTRHGMEDLIALDPGARWDSGSQTIVNSAFAESPRIGLVPFFDPTLPPGSGRNWVTVVKLGAFFIEGVQGNGEVTGRFIQITTGGMPCGNGLGNGLVKGIVLIE